MTIHIELEPEEEHRLRERARETGHDLAGYVRQVLRDLAHVPTEPGGWDDGLADPEGLLDREFIAYCAREADERVTPEQVLEATSRIGDSMARVVVEEERAERF